MSYELRSPVENFLNWESNKGKETFLIQPINGKNHEFSWERVGIEARKFVVILRVLIYLKIQKSLLYLKTVHIG